MSRGNLLSDFDCRAFSEVINIGFEGQTKASNSYVTHSFFWISLQELGYSDFFQVAWWGVFTPKGTPAAVRSTLEQTLLKVYADAESKEYLDKNNFSAFLGDAAVLRKFQEAEIKRESRLVREFNIPRM